jgi:hypothetical protein
MTDPTRGDPREPQPWHADDEAHDRKKDKPTGVPIGTHSLTGGGASVGLPDAPMSKEHEPERSEPREAPPGAEEPDPLMEPRAGGGDLLGRR